MCDYFVIVYIGRSGYKNVQLP